MSLVSLTVYDYVMILGYLVMVVLLGLKYSKNENNSVDYLLGGRKMPWLAVGISILMSLLSTYSMVMVPGEIFNFGLSMWVLALLQPFVAILAFMFFVRFYFKIKAFTPFEYLERRYDKKIRALVASLYAYSTVLYLAMVLFSSAKIFEACAGWPAWATILVVGVVGVAYTVMGGMKAVVWTDVLQFFVFGIGLGVAIFYLCRNIEGGFFEAITYAFAHGRGVDRFSEADFYKLSPYIRLSFWLLLLSYILGPFGGAASDQITIQRLLSTSSYKNALKATITSSCLTIPASLVIWFIGLAVFTYYAQNPDPRVTTGDTAFFVFIATKLPIPVPGLILAAMLAAAMSTLDSGINSLSTIWLKEFHQKYINPAISDLRQVKVSRYSTTLIGVFIVGLALMLAHSSKLLEQTFVEVTTIFAIFAIIVFPAFLFAVLSRRSNSLFIWLMAVFLWGMKIGMVTWYAVTKRISVIWEKGAPLGLAGAISLTWVIIPLAIAALLLLLWFFYRHAEGKKPKVFLITSLAPLGFAVATTLWFIFSNIFQSETPKVLSFQWAGFPVTVALFVAGFIGLKMSPIQLKHKYQGLTMATAGEAIIEDINAK